MSPMADLLSAKQRENVADMVNASVISAGLEASDTKDKPLVLPLYIHQLQLASLFLVLQICLQIGNCRSEAYLDATQILQEK